MDLEIENQRKTELKKTTAVETFTREVELKVAANAHGVERYSGLVLVPPGLTAASSNCQKWALAYYGKVSAAEAKSKTTTVDEKAKAQAKYIYI